MQASTVDQKNPSILKILRAAGACFGRNGYHCASMSAIAREASVSKSLLHYHFDTKEQLFIEVQLLMFRNLLERIRRLRGFSAQPSDVLSVALEEVMTFIESDIDQMRVLIEFQAVGVTNPRIAIRLEQFDDEVTRIVTEGIQNTLGEHTERLSLPPDRLARVLRTLFNGLIVELAYAPSEERRQLVLRTFNDIKGLVSTGVLRELS